MSADPELAGCNEEYVTEFPLNDGIQWGHTDEMERRKRLVEIARHLEMMALYERKPIRAVIIQWRDGGGADPGGWKLRVGFGR